MTERNNIFTPIKIAFFLISFLMINSCTNTQTEINSGVDKNYKSPIPSNDSVQFEVVLASCDTCVPIQTKGFRVSLDEQPSNISAISNNQWLQLLRTDSTNFSASVHLYYLHDKEAFLLSKYSTQTLWNKYLKERDLEFWFNILAEK